MTFRGLTELQEQSRNATHMSPITNRVETNGRNQPDHTWIWIAAGDGSPPEMDRDQKWIAASHGSRPERHCGQRWMTRDGSHPEMDRGRIWISTGYGLLSGGRWQEMDHRRRMTINLLSHMKLRGYNRVRICTHTVFQRHGFCLF